MKKLLLFIIGLSTFCMADLPIINDYTQQCQEGNISSCSDLGDIYFEQDNYAEAITLYEQACAGQEGHSCNRAGYIYDKGSLGKADAQKALEFYQKAADLKDRWGYFNLAAEYRLGTAIEQDYDKAIAYYLKSCHTGATDGCTELGDIYYNGEITKQNLLTAKEYYTIACDMEDAYGCYSLGYMLEQGEGAEKSIDRAKQWYQKACDLKYEDGCKALTTVGTDDEGSTRGVVVFSIVLMFIVAVRMFYFRKKKKS